jgi:hypothetical protein
MAAEPPAPDPRVIAAYLDDVDLELGALSANLKHTGCMRRERDPRRGACQVHRRTGSRIEDVGGPRFERE